MTHPTQTLHDQTTVSRSDPPLVKRISWGAVSAGLITAVIIQVLLTLLGVGIGAATVDPLQERAPGEGLGIGAGVWFLVSSLIAMYVGGRVAGRFSGAPTKRDRMLHGVFTWATTTILSVTLLASAAGSLLGGAASMLGSAAGTAVKAPPAQPGAQQPVPVPNEQEARAAADVAAKRVSQSAISSFFLLVLSGLAAALGGRSTAPRGGHDYIHREEHTHGEPSFAKS